MTETPPPAAEAARGRARSARPRDVDELAALFAALVAHHGQLGPAFAARPDAPLEATARRWLTRELAAADTRILVWEEAGELPGLCVARVVRRPPLFVETARGAIDYLVVRPEARRRGVGRALLEAAEDWLRGEGASRLEIAVARGNAEGRAFWRALGFRPAMDVLERSL